jgi:hypothetical protein
MRTTLTIVCIGFLSMSQALGTETYNWGAPTQDVWAEYPEYFAQVESYDQDDGAVQWGDDFADQVARW